MGGGFVATYYYLLWFLLLVLGLDEFIQSLFNTLLLLFYNGFFLLSVLVNRIPSLFLTNRGFC